MAYLGIRISDELDAEIEALRNRMNYAGLLPVRLSKSDLVRMALEYMIELDRQGRIAELLKKPSS